MRNTILGISTYAVYDFYIGIYMYICIRVEVVTIARAHKNCMIYTPSTYYPCAPFFCRRQPLSTRNIFFLLNYP